MNLFNFKPRPPAVLAPLFCLILCLFLAAPAHAGMSFNPLTFDLNQAASYRAQALSFFLALSLVIAWLIKLLWNHLRNDFPKLPQLSYWRSLGLVLLWGLFIALIMSMTTAARSLTTPGAWERTGAQYKLTDPAQELREKRRATLEGLKPALMAYADAHGNRFPHHTGEISLPSSAFQSAHPNRSSLIFIPLRARPSSPEMAMPLVYEPDIFNDDRFCLLTDGTIRQIDNSQLITLSLLHDPVPITQSAQRPATQPAATQP
jgi:hypothetical protein